MFEQLTNKFKLHRILLFRIFPIRHFIWSLGLGEPQFSRIEEEINGPDTMANLSPGFSSLLVFASLILAYAKSDKSKWELGWEQPIFRGRLPDYNMFLSCSKYKLYCRKFSGNVCKPNGKKTIKKRDVAILHVGEMCAWNNLQKKLKIRFPIRIGRCGPRKIFEKKNWCNVGHI